MTKQEELDFDGLKYKKLTFSGVKNEYVSAQVFIGAYKNVDNYYLEVSDLKSGNNVLEAENFDVYKAIRYIQLLELNDDEDITIEDVNNAYRQLSKIYHPDIANSRYGDGKKFVELQEAKDYLLENIEEVKHLVCKYFK